MKRERAKILKMTFIDLFTHFTVTLLLSVYFYKISSGFIWPLLSIAGGIFIDIDHFIDYFLFFGPRFDLKCFLAHEYQVSGKCYVFFHSWELLVFLWLFSPAFSLIVPFVSGLTLHMFIDAFISHRSNPLYLSLLYRAVNRFRIYEKIMEDRRSDAKRDV
jgi:hypothetical protein